MTKSVIGEPRWNEKRKHWRVSVQREGKRKDFYSSNPSRRAGPAECKRKAQAWIESLEAPSDIYFSDAWEEYLDYYGQKYKITSLKEIEARGKAHLLPAFTHKKLAAITKSDWQNVIFTAYENGARSKATLKGTATTIRTFCKWASTKGYIADSDVPIYFAYPTEKLSKEKKILQPEEFAMLFAPEEDDSNWYINAFRFFPVSGVRRGELCALQRKRDFDGEKITIRESISHQGYITNGKTPDSNRTLYLGYLAKECIHMLEFQLMAAGIRDRKYLFCDQHGQRISPRVLRNEWQKWREAHGIDITLHELRHTYISYSRLKTDISLDDLKRLYGHSKGMDTDKVYVHEINASPEELIERREKDRKNAQTIDTTIKKLIEDTANNSAG
ncbi:MAG: tyrosine-type recombinase/integrase [Eubacteriales bacterium]|nr:tyrosine-type recombinase/integrase [Eubacteriales bacterium]